MPYIHVLADPFPPGHCHDRGCAVNPVTQKREIMEFNGITDESSLRPGRKLKIKPVMKR